MVRMRRVVRVANQYSPKQFLRQVPNSLLKDFFDRRGALLDLNWNGLDEMDADPIFEAWHALPEASRNEVERSFRAVADLANTEGLQVLIEEGKFHKEDLAASFELMKGLHEKSFWVYLNHDRIFTAASRLNRADHLNGRYWRRRTDLRATSPDISHPTRKLLGDAISQYYRENQGRGEHCKVEVYLRRETLHYFFAYPADYADTVVIYSDGGELLRQLQKSAFDVIFAYNESVGTLDVFVEGDKTVRHAMEEMFARLILKQTLPDESTGNNPFYLDGLRNRDFDFPTDPADQVESVAVKSLRFSLGGPTFGRITFESHPRARKGDIYNLIEKALNEQQEPEDLTVTQVSMQVKFRAISRSKTVTFQISHPDSCNLKDKPEHLKIKEYLRRWGIARE
jgi:hypothetical protein